jgi:hypothetical protein
VALAFRYPISASLVFAALLATASVLAFARPQFNPAIEVENVNLAKEPHYSVADVKDAFAAEGIRFDHTVRDADSEMTWLGQGPPPWPDPSLYVTILPEHGALGLGHGEWEEAVFEGRVGNVLVHYGGRDEHILEQVKGAVASLAPHGPRSRF